MELPEVYNDDLVDEVGNKLSKRSVTSPNSQSLASCTIFNGAFCFEFHPSAMGPYIQLIGFKSSVFMSSIYWLRLSVFPMQWR